MFGFIKLSSDPGFIKLSSDPGFIKLSSDPGFMTPVSPVSITHLARKLKEISSEPGFT